MTVAAPFGRAEIERILPHREPFLLIDEVVELKLKELSDNLRALEE